MKRKARTHQSEQLSIPGEIERNTRGIIDNTTSQSKYGVKVEEEGKANGNRGDSWAKANNEAGSRSCSDELGIGGRGNET